MAMTWTERSTIAANVSIIVLAAFTCLFGIWRFTPFLHTSTPEPSASVAVGEQVAVPNVRWAESPKTIVLALSTRCHFCNESAPFYKSLLDSAAATRVPVVAVLPEPDEEVRKHFADLGVAFPMIRQSPLDAVYVRGTPTILLVNRDGKITSGWVGKLSQDKEKEVLAAIART